MSFNEASLTGFVLATVGSLVKRWMITELASCEKFGRNESEFVEFGKFLPDWHPSRYQFNDGRTMQTSCGIHNVYTLQCAHTLNSIKQTGLWNSLKRTLARAPENTWEISRQKRIGQVTELVACLLKRTK